MHVEEFSNSKIQQNYTVNFYLEAVHAGSMMQHKNVKILIVLITLKLHKFKMCSTSK
jgi:hypothetical protein